MFSYWVDIAVLRVIWTRKKQFRFLKTDGTWNQEVFHFPIPFAPEIKFE
jgi:hypothetical protein